MTRRAATIVLGAIIAGIAVVAIGGVLFLDGVRANALPEADLALESGDGITVDQDGWITFMPDEPSATGFIFYPGGLVDPVAYAPPVREIAEAGYLSVIVPMPFGLAVLDAGAANDVIEAHPQIERWVLGGHSLGGAMAAQFADDEDDELAGLALWGAYPADGDDLSDQDLMAVSVYASEDGLSTVEEIEATAGLMPSETSFVRIEGGNHAGFGLYGPQDGDGIASISPQDQQTQTVAATIELLEAVSAEDGSR